MLSALLSQSREPPRPAKGKRVIMEEQAMRCPYCGGRVPAETTICPDCQEDLSGLARLEYAHLVYYNQAVALAREGDLKGAERKLAVALEIKEDFAPAHAVAAKLAAQGGRWSEARASAARALELAPDDAELEALAQSINQAAVEEAASQEAQVQERRQRANRLLRSYQRDVVAAFAFGLGIAGAIATLISGLRHRDEGERDDE